MSNEANPSDKKSLASPINEASEKVSSLNNHMSQLIQSFRTQGSWLTVIASTWYALSWWQKGLITLGVVGPMLTLGIFFHLAVLTTISLCMGLFIAISTMLLHQHAEQDNEDLEAFQTKCLGLTKSITEIMRSLSLLSQTIDKEVKTFQHENSKLSQHIFSLEQDIKRLTRLIHEFSNVEEGYKTILSALEGTQYHLEESLATQKAQAQSIQQAFEAYVKEASSTQMRLTQDISALEELNASLQKEHDKAKRVVISLQSAVGSLVSLATQSSHDQTTFKQQLHDVIEKGEGAFFRSAEKLETTERDLAHIKEAYVQLLKHQEQLVQRHEAEITRLEARAYTSTPTHEQEPALSALLLTQLGVFENEGRGQRLVHASKPWALLLNH